MLRCSPWFSSIRDIKSANEKIAIQARMQTGRHRKLAHEVTKGLTCSIQDGTLKDWCLMQEHNPRC